MDARLPRGSRPVVSLLVVLSVIVAAGVLAAEGGPPFSRTAVDVAIVVRDIESSLHFYREGLGFQADEGHTVPAGLAERLGLSNGETLDVHVMVPAMENTASRLKLIAVRGADTAVAEPSSIPSMTGFRYITVFVTDIDRTARQLEAAGVPAAEVSPLALGEGSPSEVFVMLVSDPDGNRIEIVGPRSEE